MRLVLVALGCGLSSATSIVPSTASCDALGSCSPEACVASSDEDCSFNNNAPDFAALVASVSCQECTQATSGFACASPGTTLKTDAGIKAAYCTDECLVVWATGKPWYVVVGEGKIVAIQRKPWLL